MGGGEIGRFFFIIYYISTLNPPPPPQKKRTTKMIFLIEKNPPHAASKSEKAVFTAQSLPSLQNYVLAQRTLNHSQIISTKERHGPIWDR